MTDLGALVAASALTDGIFGGSGLGPEQRR